MEIGLFYSALICSVLIPIICSIVYFDISKSDIVMLSPKLKLMMFFSLLIISVSLGLYSLLGSSHELKDYYSQEKKYERIQRKTLRIAENNWNIKALRLNVHLHSQPQDSQAWKTLAKHYLIKKDYVQAELAFQNAVVLEPDNTDVYLDWLTVKAQNNSGILLADERHKIKEMLEGHERYSLMVNLLAVDAFKRKSFDVAADYWSKLLGTIPDTNEGHQALESIKRLISRSVQAHKGPKIIVNAALSEDMATQVKPSDIIFILAKSPAGMPMPLAAVRTQVKDLDKTITLSLTDAMDPNWSLSNVDEVILEAFVSSKQVAEKSIGDIWGRTGVIKLDSSHTDSVSLLLNSRFSN